MMWKKKNLIKVVNEHLIDYPSPVNITYLWSVGSLAGLCLVIQMVTGILLSMHYTPHMDYAFCSVEHIMRDVRHGWLIRYTHANGASMMFLCLYIHIFKNLYYGSYTAPRHWLWISGVVLLLLTMATSFLGYCLPWGQMSFWGATVITNLFSAVPFIGNLLTEILWGGEGIDNPTLNRFYSLHYLLPFVMAGLSLVHLTLLHVHGNNNPLGIESHASSIPFYPYFFAKDLFALFSFLILFSFFVFFYPNALGHTDNYLPAECLKTPSHIVPEWYFLPFYAILRSIPQKTAGVAAMFGSLLVLMVIPFITPKLHIRSSVFRPFGKGLFWLQVMNCILLGWVGQMEAGSPFEEIGQIATVFYFAYFLVLVPSSIHLENRLLLGKWFFANSAPAIYRFIYYMIFQFSFYDNIFLPFLLPFYLSYVCPLRNKIFTEYQKVYPVRCNLIIIPPRRSELTGVSAFFRVNYFRLSCCGFHIIYDGGIKKSPEYCYFRSADRESYDAKIIRLKIEEEVYEARANQRVNCPQWCLDLCGIDKERACADWLPLDRNRARSLRHLFVLGLFNRYGL